MEKETLQPNIYFQLSRVQYELKVPKGHKGRFGEYSSAEDILTAVKPLLNQHGLALVLSCDVSEVGGRNYVVASATVWNDMGQSLCATAEAWEGEINRGLDASQVTGSAISYARKYAMGGLFAIDDTTDADGETDPIELAKPKAPVKAPVKPVVAEQKPEDPVTPKQKQQLKNMMTGLGMDKDGMSMMIVSVLEKDTVDTLEDFNKIIEALES